jgi:hypothetical protein
MSVIEKSLPQIHLTLDQHERRDIYNMDETGLFYRMQVSACSMILYAHCQTIDLFSLTHDISTGGQFLGHKTA